MLYLQLTLFVVRVHCGLHIKDPVTTTYNFAAADIVYEMS